MAGAVQQVHCQQQEERQVCADVQLAIGVRGGARVFGGLCCASCAVLAALGKFQAFWRQKNPKILAERASLRLQVCLCAGEHVFVRVFFVAARAWFGSVRSVDLDCIGESHVVAAGSAAGSARCVAITGCV